MCKCGSVEAPELPTSPNGSSTATTSPGATLTLPWCIGEISAGRFGQIGYHQRIEVYGILGLERAQPVPLDPIGPSVK